MKIARVFIQAYPGRQVGDIHDVFAPENHPGALLSGIIKECEVADDFDQEIMSAVVDENGDVSFGEDAEKVAAKVLKAKEAQIAVKYNEMNAEVYEEMEEIFGTSKSDSATAYYETWKLMKDKPGLFVSAGLLVDRDTAGMVAGEPLDTEQKIVLYAETRIGNAEAYAVWRAQRIKQFAAEKAAILAG